MFERGTYTVHTAITTVPFKGLHCYKDMIWKGVVAIATFPKLPAI
jgi:hypothetical protein